MRHFRSKAFKKLYTALPLETRQLADKNFALLRQNPQHPSLHFKHLRDSIWSARVGIGHRALAMRGQDRFQWFWIDPHDEYERII